MRKKPETAEQLMARLEADPDFVLQRSIREAEIAEQLAVLAREEATLVTELKELGYDVDSVWDLVNNSPHPVLPRRFIGPYERAYPTLVRHLEAPYSNLVREGLIRALTVGDGGRLVQDALLAQFQNETNPDLRFALANALRAAMPYRERRKQPAIAEAFRLGGLKESG